MSQSEFIGYLAVYGVVFIGGLIALIKPIISLNVNIQKLSDSINHINSDTSELKKDIDKQQITLNDHETRLTVIERSKNNE